MKREGASWTPSRFKSYEKKKGRKSKKKKKVYRREGKKITDQLNDRR